MCPEPVLGDPHCKKCDGIHHQLGAKFVVEADEISSILFEAPWTIKLLVDVDVTIVRYQQSSSLHLPSYSILTSSTYRFLHPADNRVLFPSCNMSLNFLS